MKSAMLLKGSFRKILLQKKPSKGFRRWVRKTLQKDLKELHTRLQGTGEGRNHRIVLYRIAASVAGLILVTSVYLAFNQKIRNLKSGRMARVEETRQQQSGAEKEQSITKTPEDKSAAKSTSDTGTLENTLSGQPGAENQSTGTSSGPEKEKFIKDNVGKPTEVIQEKTPVEAPSVSSRQSDLPVEILSQENEKSVAAPQLQNQISGQKRAVPATRKATDKKMPAYSIVMGNVISADDSSPLPGAVIRLKGTNQGTVTNEAGNFELKIPGDTSATLIAGFIGMDSREVRVLPGTDVRIRLEPSLTQLDEVVVVGYGTVKKNDLTGSVTMAETDNDNADYAEPEPIDGYSNFRTYIKDNLTFPPGHPDLKRAVVVLRFSVGPDKRPTDIEVLKSPGQDFSDEAIHLLKNGPDWQPAKINGTMIDVQTRLRIVFEREDEKDQK